MALYDIYEKDGAVFRKPASAKQAHVDQIQKSDGSWVDYEGDRMAPYMFGDDMGQKDLLDEAAAPERQPDGPAS